jgi:hypothetical protein
MVMITPESAADLAALLKKYLEAQKASERAMEARMKLAAGSTRARSTTANARWAQAAEGRDRLQEAVQRKIDTMAESVSARSPSPTTKP